jgi:hypothetical protein
LDVLVDYHALKHGLTEDEILFAWENFVRKQHRSTPNSDQIAAVGCDRSGKLIQMVAIEKQFGILIYHAMAPPTAKVLIELGLIRRD